LRHFARAGVEPERIAFARARAADKGMGGGVLQKD